MLITLLGLALPLASTSVAAAEPSAGPTTAPQAWLNGAFGRVAGGEPANPAAAAPDDSPLDTWMQGAPLTLQIDVPSESVAGLQVRSQPLADGAAGEILSDGATMFAGPDTPGVTVVTATFTTEGHGSSQLAWLLEVPEREGGDEVLLDMPGPRAMLASLDGSVAGEPGNGCYVYLCVDVGYRPPTATLEMASVALGEPPMLHLSDGSAMTGWTGILTPIGEMSAKAQEAEASYPLEPRATVALTGLEPSTAGEWLLEVRTDYDRERGWQWFLYRLSAE